METTYRNIIGKVHGAPVYEFLGSAMRDRVTVYSNGWYTQPVSPDDYARKTKTVAAKGSKALKFDPFGTMYPSGDVDQISRAVAIIKNVRDSVGERIELLIEGHLLQKFKKKSKHRFSLAIAYLQTTCLQFCAVVVECKNAYIANSHIFKFIVTTIDLNQ